jgi:glycerophosphoryl diester phosphodiesterase
MSAQKPYLLIAHRGDKKNAPENTIKACELALAQGATGLEVDVRICSDGELVLMHDPTLRKHFGSYKPVLYTSVSQLKAQHYRNDYRHDGIVCTLEEFLEHFRHTVPINLDAKFWGVRPARFAKRLVQLIDRMNMADQVWISSFNPFLLHRLKVYKPTIRTGYLFQDPVRVYQMIDPFLDSDAWHPHFKNATPRLLEKALRLKKEIYVWTVNREEVLQRIENYPINGIITDEFFRTQSLPGQL